MLVGAFVEISQLIQTIKSIGNFTAVRGDVKFAMRMYFVFVGAQSHAAS